MSKYLLRRLAAEHLSGKGIPTSEQALADQATRGIGPHYSIVRGRAIYTVEDLDTWLAEQIAKPVTRRSSRAKKDTKLIAAAPDLAEALGPDAAGRDFADLLLAVAYVLRQSGGGPLEGCLRAKADQIRAALVKAGL